jgi:hypothetical protein
MFPRVSKDELQKIMHCHLKALWNGKGAGLLNPRMQEEIGAYFHGNVISMSLVFYFQMLLDILQFHGNAFSQSTNEVAGGVRRLCQDFLDLMDRGSCGPRTKLEATLQARLRFLMDASHPLPLTVNGCIWERNPWVSTDRLWHILKGRFDLGVKYFIWSLRATPSVMFLWDLLVVGKYLNLKNNILHTLDRFLMDFYSILFPKPHFKKGAKATFGALRRTATAAAVQCEIQGAKFRNYISSNDQAILPAIQPADITGIAEGSRYSTIPVPEADLLFPIFLMEKAAFACHGELAVDFIAIEIVCLNTLIKVRDIAHDLLGEPYFVEHGYTEVFTYRGLPGVTQLIMEIAENRRDETRMAVMRRTVMAASAMLSLPMHRFTTHIK